jgi:hypothetical protein
VFGKGAKERKAPIGRYAADSLRAYLDSGRHLLEKKFGVSPYLFLGKRTPVLSRQAVCYLLGRRSQRAGISHVHPHMLRHSAATHMMNGGADLRVIQEILGHADIGTTEVYTHASKEHVKGALLRCHPRNNPRRAQIALFQSAVPTVVPTWMPCGECSKPAARGKKLCERHLQLAREASQRFYRRRRLEQEKGQNIQVA